MAAFRCEKCGRLMDEKNFYTYKDGKKTELCKKCLTMHIDCFNPDTFLWILQKMDLPYIESRWNNIRDKDYAKDPKKFNPTAVFGKYVASMKLKAFSELGWDDNERLKEEEEEKNAQRLQQRLDFEHKVKEEYERGEITEAQYRTLVRTETQVKDDEKRYIEEELEKKTQQEPTFFNERDFIKEEELDDPANDLTQEDKVYLAMKWGRLYKPGEWIELEKKYNDMKESFSIEDSDTEGTLVLICKTYLKMNQAIDMGDLDSYQKLARTYDTLRKSGKFTAVQNKEVKENDFVSSVGELVAYCEKEGGKIPRFEIKTDLDIVDKVIKDLKEYNKSLIYEDASLARQIEDYLKKREISERIKEEKRRAKEEGREYTLKDEDIKDYNNMITEQEELDKELMNYEFTEINDAI